MRRTLLNLCNLLAFLALISFGNPAHAKRQLSIVFKKVECKSLDRALYPHFECYLENKPDRNGFTVTEIIGRQAPDLMAQGSFFILLNNGTQSLKVMTAERHVCEFLNEVATNNLLRILNATFKKFANKMQKCPYHLNFTYIFKDVYLGTNDIPAYLPEGIFKFVCYLVEYGEKKMFFSVEAEVTHKRKRSGGG